MSPAKTTTKKPAKKAVKRSTTRPAVRKLSASHKAALAQGRTMSATVDRYLAAVNTPKRRGRKVTKATLEQRLVQAQTQVKTATGVEKVLAAQNVRDLRAKLAQASVSSDADLKSLEAAFVKVAKRFAENRGISYGAWRAAGVSADVLRKAGVPRRRG